MRPSCEVSDRGRVTAEVREVCALRVRRVLSRRRFLSCFVVLVKLFSRRGQVEVAWPSLILVGTAFQTTMVDFRGGATSTRLRCRFESTGNQKRNCCKHVLNVRRDPRASFATICGATMATATRRINPIKSTPPGLLSSPSIRSAPAHGTSTFRFAVFAGISA